MHTSSCSQSILLITCFRHCGRQSRAHLREYKQGEYPPPASVHLSAFILPLHPEICQYLCFLNVIGFPDALRGRPCSWGQTFLRGELTANFCQGSARDRKQAVSFRESRLNRRLASISYVPCPAYVSSGSPPPSNRSQSSLRSTAAPRSAVHREASYSL